MPVVELCRISTRSRIAVNTRLAKPDDIMLLHLNIHQGLIRALELYRIPAAQGADPDSTCCDSGHNLVTSRRVQQGLNVGQ
jgi:hypothetical protein